MANKYPLQAGDRAPDFSGRDASTAGDRRTQASPPVESFEGNQAAPSKHQPDAGPLWRPGQIAPEARNSAPFPCIHTEGDTSGTGTKVYEIDICSYGDTYDPTAPTRIRTVDNYELDSDYDGHLN